MTTQQLQKINGINLDAVQQLVDQVSQNSEKGKLKFQVSTAWMGGPQSRTQVKSWEFGGESKARNFAIDIDEPVELFGNNSAPNPQEMLMAAMNACVLATYVALCALQGIELESLEIETEGELDLRGFFGLDPSVIPGYNELCYTIHVNGSGTPEQFEEIHQMVQAVSPNFWNLAKPVTLTSKLQVQN